MEIVRRIKRIIKKSSNVFISGHKNLDLDAIGSCVGISCICNHYKKDNYIIVDDEVNEPGVSKILDEIKDTNKIIESTEVPNLCNGNSTLIIVDVSKKALLQNPDIIDSFKNVIVLDHHQISEVTIPGISYIDDKYSSASEIVANLIEFYRIKPTKEEATIVLSGIALDTNNFTVKTSSNTYFTAYFLSKFGADSKKVKYYLKEDLNDYIIRNKVIVNVEIINNHYAVAKAPKHEKYRREDLAKMADTLLKFNEIDASFIIGERIDDGVGISARSEGKVDVGSITTILGGGGDTNTAACQILDKDIDTVYKELKDILTREG